MESIMKLNVIWMNTKPEYRKTLGEAIDEADKARAREKHLGQVSKRANKA